MKCITFVAVSSFSSFAVLLRRTDVVTTENGQRHVNQCFALTLDSLNTALDSFFKAFKSLLNKFTSLSCQLIAVSFQLEKDKKD